ncbi:S-layer homology domain-containing protein, partial [Paenibacillus whitsoniae]
GTDPGTGPGTEPETEPGTIPGDNPSPAAGAALKLAAASSPDAAGVAKAAATQAAIEQALAGAPGGTLTLDFPKVEGARAYEAALPAPLLTEGSAARQLALQTEFGTITLPNDMFKPGETAGKANVSITLKQVGTAGFADDVKTAIGDRPVIDITIMLDGTTTAWNNPKAPVRVAIPYQPSQAERNQLDGITVWYLDGTGRPTPVTSGRYEASTGTVTFLATHFSSYAVVYVTKTFSDLAGYSWAQKPIEALAAKGIIAGISETAFSPGVAIKRADFVLLLMRTMGFPSQAAASFADAGASAYYADAVQTARALGIADGSGDNRFQPEAAISRQDMMALTARALRIAGQLPAATLQPSLAGFKDGVDVADYAQASISGLIRLGIVEGDGGYLRPLASTSRAEIAVLLYRIYQSLGGN